MLSESLESFEKQRKRAQVGVDDTSTRKDPQELYQEPDNEIRGLLRQISRNMQPTRRFAYGQITGVEDVRGRFPSFICDYGVIIKAHQGHAFNIYVGDKNVDNVGGSMQGGFELDANQSIIIPIRQLQDLYYLDNAGGQLISWWAM